MPSAEGGESLKRRKAGGPRFPPVYPTFHRFVDPGIKPEALRVHPKGFKVLSKSSPLDRNITTYFRLPPQPSKRVAEERKKVELRASTVAGADALSGVLLDGFMLLEAAGGVTDPSDVASAVVQDCRLVGAVTDDLNYYSASLTFLDVGENTLELEHLEPLRSLKELHMHCNLLNHLPAEPCKRGEAEEQWFPSLQTLNLSFNQIPSSEIAHLQLISTSLCRLDLSSNNLGNGLAIFNHGDGLRDCLPSLTHIALENNNMDSPDVIMAIGRLPCLVEVNLNFNRFEGWPRVLDATLFPKLRMVGMAANAITYFEDVYPLKTMATLSGRDSQSLERLVLWGNPIERRQKDRDIVVFEFDIIKVVVNLQPPVPSKKKGSQFCKFGGRPEDTVPLVKVTPVDSRGLDRTKRAGKTSSRQPKEETVPPPTSTRQQDDGSFFVTQVDVPSTEQESYSAESAPQWFNGSAHEASSLKQGYRTATQSAVIPSSDPSLPPILRQSLSAAAGRQFEEDGEADVDICRPNATLRSVMTELKRVLRQPLPPVFNSRIGTLAS